MSNHPGLYFGGPAATLPKLLSTGFERYLRVILSGGQLAVAGALDREVGTVGLSMPASGLGSDISAPVVIPYAEGCPWMVSAGAIAQYADVYGAANGQAGATRNGNYIGIALKATANAGEWFPVLRMPGRVGGLLFSNLVPSTAVSNTTTETKFDQNFTLPANLLNAGDVLRIRAQGIFTAVNSTNTQLCKLYLGSIVLAQTAAVNPTANDEFYFDAEVIVRTNGSSGTVVSSGLQTLGTPGTATAYPFLKASTAIDTTATQQIAVSDTCSVANAGNSARLDMLTVERKAA